jgi:hypothetical protein
MFTTIVYSDRIVVLQREIDEITDHLQHWGVAVASDGEFIVPDDFGSTPAAPVTPTLYLIAGCHDILLHRNHVQKLNQTAEAASREYLVARDFSKCPM